MLNRKSSYRFPIAIVTLITIAAVTASANWVSGYSFNLFGLSKTASDAPQLTVPLDVAGELDRSNEDADAMKLRAGWDAKPKVEEPAGPQADGPSADLIGAATYGFTATSAIPLEDMSSGTTLLMAADIDDSASAIAPIGFEFWYDGVRNTTFSANANGLMRLGVVAVGTTFTNSIGSTTNSPQIAPYWDDLWIGNNGKVHYKVVGIAPNRKLVVEWQNEQVPRVAAANAGAGTFQAWLFEKSGVIEFVYGSGMAANAGGASIGLQSGAATNFASVTASTNTVSYAVADDLNTVAIPSGTAYIFTPNAPLAPTVLNFTAIGLNTMTLNWTDNASNEFGYAIYRSLDGVSYDFVTLTAANATSSVQTGIASNTAYFWQVYAVSEGAVSSVLSGSQATTTGTVVGTRSVGPTGTYLSLTAAAADINTNGLAGNVLLELQAAYVSAVETFPLVFSAKGSPTNTLTIRPETGAVALSITSADATATLDMNTTTNVTIDGRAGGAGPSQLTIANTSLTGAAVRLINGASRNTVRFATITGVNNTSTGGVVLFSTSTAGTGNNNNTIDNCNVQDGATTPVNGILSLGTSSTALINTRNTISNNNISNFHSATIASNGINVSTNNTNWTISNNRIFQTLPRASTASITHRGILVVPGAGHDFTVTGNVVGFANSAGTGTYTLTGTLANAFVGIQVQAGTSPIGSSIQNNTVAGISQATTTGSLIGISVTAGSANIGNVTGNTVGSGTGNGSLTNTPTGAAFIVGLNASGSALSTVVIANNTIGSLTATGNPSTVNPNLNVVQLTGGAITFSNNLLGSTTTANSIQTTTAGTSATGQQLITIFAGTTMPITISGNTLANITNSGTGTAHVIRGIQIQSPALSAALSGGKGTISGNTVRDLTGANSNTSALGVTGIFLTTGTGGMPGGGLIEGNTVFSISNTNTGAFSTGVAGIGMSGSSSTVGVTGGVVSKNKVYDLRNASTGTSAIAPPRATGIYAQTGTTFMQVSNNMVSLGNAQTTNTQFMGIWNDFSTSATLISYYNSIHIEGVAAAGALPSYGLLRGDNTAASAVTSPVDIKNSIFDNTRTGGTGKHYAIGNVNTVPATGWGAGASNYNVLNSASAATVGIWGLATDETFASWKIDSASDAASLQGDPLFVNPVNDLHQITTTNSVLKDKGIAVSVLDDFDGQIRSVVGFVGGVPDIGADEPTAPTAANASVSGRVTTADGRGIRNAILTISGGSLTTPRFVRTGSFGYYSFEDLPAGETYVVTISSKRYIFSNPSRVITLNDSITDADFTAEAQ